MEITWRSLFRGDSGGIQRVFRKDSERIQTIYRCVLEMIHRGFRSESEMSPGELERELERIEVVGRELERRVRGRDEGELTPRMILRKKLTRILFDSKFLF